METTTDYHVNIFKMKTPFAKANAKLIITLVIIWFTAVIGFQILLKVIEKPVPEKVLLTFEETWPRVQNGLATQQEKAIFAKSLLLVIGKGPAEKDKVKLLESFNWSIQSLLPVGTQAGDLDKIIEALAPMMEVENNGVEMKLLAFYLNKQVAAQLNTELPVIMKKYLIHNQSFLTDFKFLGFPFHYWYTAEFLLILFVFLCWFYCKRVITLQKKYNIKED